MNRKEIISLITQGWNLSRFIRLGLGLLLMWQTIASKDFIIGMLAATMLLQAVFNTGCCANGACTSPLQKNKSNDTLGETTYEEIK